MTDTMLSQPTARTYRLAALVKSVLDGDVRVPHFQRSFRWDARDVVKLFDSVLRGFPVGSVLLWQRDAPANHDLRLGAIRLDVPARPNALWVVDGQQRITSLVNAVDQNAWDLDERFRLVYDLKSESVMHEKDGGIRDTVPLPVLFNLRKLLSWVQEHPSLADSIIELNEVATRLQNFELPASVVVDASQKMMQEIFDRMNSSGKRLRRAEIFSALFAAEEQDADTALTVSAVGDRIAGDTTFGRIDDDTILQVILARRGNDTTRDIRREFDSEAKRRSEFPDEGRDGALAAGEQALRGAVAFLQNTAGVTHFALLPYRFLLITLARFLAHFPQPHARNAELLSRWFWQAALVGPEIFKSSSTAAIRTFNAKVVPGDETGSVQGLLRILEREQSPIGPNLRRFRTNDSSTRIVLAAMWDRGPRSFETAELLSPSDIAEALDGKTTALNISLEIVGVRQVKSERRQWAANRVLSVDSSELALDVLMADSPFVALDRGRFGDVVRRSHIVSDRAAHALDRGDFEAFLDLRNDDLTALTADFLGRRTGSGLESTPPLEDFDFDDDRDDLTGNTA